MGSHIGAYYGVQRVGNPNARGNRSDFQLSNGKAVVGGNLSST